MVFRDAEDRAYFEERAKCYLGPLYGVALRLLGNAADAEDLVQETFLRAYRTFRRQEAETFLRTFLFKILINLVRDEWRNRRRVVKAHEEVPLNLSEQGREAGRSSLRPESPEEVLGRAQTRTVISEALDALPLEYRAPVVLADIEGFSYREISDALGLPKGTVMSRLYRGRRRLRQLLQPHLEALGLMPKPGEGTAESKVVNRRN